VSPRFYRLVWFFATALIAAGFVHSMITTAPGATPDEWFKLVVELQKKERCLYGPDRAFLRNMVNLLAVDESTTPTPPQQRWILSLKKECKL
jgi:hypothetical protein